MAILSYASSYSRTSPSLRLQSRRKRKLGFKIFLSSVMVVGILSVFIARTLAAVTTFEQSSYRFFNNTDSPFSLSITSNPSNLDERPGGGVAVDQTNGYIYLAGYGYIAANDQRWRIEKRKLSTGAYCTAAECGTEFGTAGTAFSDPSTSFDQLFDIEIDVAAGYMYLVGNDSIQGAAQREWRIEKRKLSTGALCTAAECGTQFGTNGAISMDLSARNEDAFKVLLDSTGGYIFIIGTDWSGGAFDRLWNIQKRKVSTGALCTAAECGTQFGTNGIVTSNPVSNDGDDVTDGAIDVVNGYIYLAGDDIVDGNKAWRVEKRKLTTGALCTAAECGTQFGTNGVQRINISAGSEIPTDIVIDSTYLYITGQDATVSSSDIGWRIEKRKLSTGALCTAAECGTQFGTNGVISFNPSAESENATSLFIDGNNLFVAGYEFSVSSTDARQRIEKRNISTGALVTNFGEAGILTSNPSATVDSIMHMEISNNVLFWDGYNESISSTDEKWEMKAMTILDTSSTLAAQDTATIGPLPGNPFRLRMAMHIGGDTALSASGQTFKLQFAQRGNDNSCDTSFTGESYANVGSNTAVEFYDNTTPSDGLMYAPNANDPTHSSDAVISQSYEEANNFNNLYGVSLNQDGIWDFALAFDSSAPSGAAYCLRAIVSDGSLLNTYSVIPQISTPQPAAPTLTSPTNAATGYGILPAFTFRTTDPDSTYVRYKLELCTVNSWPCASPPSGFPATQPSGSPQPGWSGQDSQTSTAYVSSSTLASSTIATFTTQTSLSYGTTYYWRVAAIDPGGTNTYGDYSSIYSFTTNYVPSAPTLNNPASGATNVSLNPEFRMYATDADNDYLRYKINIYQSNCTSVVTSYEQPSGSPQTGWIGQSAQSATAYSSGQAAIYTVQSALTANTTYCWKAQAKDYGGTVTYGNESSGRLFTTQAVVAPSQVEVRIRGNVNIGGVTIDP